MRVATAEGARIPWWGWPGAVTVGVLAGALFPEAPVRDAQTLQVVSDVGLHVPAAYVVLAPLCNVLDALTLLSTRQHYAIVTTVAIVVAAWVAVPRLLGWRSSSFGRSARVCGGAAVFLVGG